MERGGGGAASTGGTGRIGRNSEEGFHEISACKYYSWDGGEALEMAHKHVAKMEAGAKE